MSAWLDTIAASLLAVWLLIGVLGPERVADMAWRWYLPLYLLCVALLLLVLTTVRVAG